MRHLEGESPLHPVTARLPYDAPRLQQIGGIDAEGGKLGAPNESNPTAAFGVS